jgi:hypothetical protein
MVACMGKRSAGRKICTSATVTATDCMWTTLELNWNRAPHHYRAAVYTILALEM